MLRLNVLLIAFIAAAFVFYVAPEFVISVLIGAAVFVFGIRWFISAARPARRRGAGWRR